MSSCAAVVSAGRTTSTSLTSRCEDDHLPDNAPTTAEEAEAAPDPPNGTESDSSRGGTLILCKDPPPPPIGGMGMNCKMIGEYTGP
jgi:hypothetical protein